MNLNKKTINTLNLNQNNIVRYMTGLSKHSHFSIILKSLLSKILKMLAYLLIKKNHT